MKKIAPKAAYDIIGSVLKLAAKATSQIAHICIGQDSTSHSGKCQRTTSPRPPQGTRKKARSCARSADRKIPSTPWRTVRLIGRSVRVRRPTARDGIDTRNSRRHWRRSSRPRRHRDGIRSSGWRRRRLIGSRMVRRPRRWPLLLSSIAYSRGACCRLWMRTIVLKSSRRFTSWVPLALAR